MEIRHVDPFELVVDALVIHDPVKQVLNHICDAASLTKGLVEIAVVSGNRSLLAGSQPD